MLRVSCLRYALLAAHDNNLFPPVGTWFHRHSLQLYHSDLVKHFPPKMDTLQKLTITPPRRIKLIMVTHPSPPRYCPPITPVLMLGNLLAWLSLIPCAVLFRTVDQESANWVMLAYTLYVCAYLFCIAAGFLSFGLKVYFSVRRVVGPSLMR